MVKFCAHCGAPFEASRSDAKFCSARCRKRANRYGSPVITGEPLRIDPSATFDDVAEALAQARAVSNMLAQLANTGPRRLRPGCQRIADGIAALIKREEW